MRPKDRATGATAPAARARRGGERGAVLVEALVAAAIVAIALLFLVALLAHEARLTARAAGQREAYELLEAALEGIRAGKVTLRLGTTPYTEADPPWLPIPERRSATLWVEVSKVDPPVPDLCEVTVRVRYRAGRDVLQRSVTTRLWKRCPP